MPASAPKKIGIISRPRRDDVLRVLPQLLKWLEKHGVCVQYDLEAAAALGKSERARALDRAELAVNSDMLLVLGGDGTTLAAARVAAPLGVPILPINMGSLGFLTSFTVEEMYPALERVLAAQHVLSERVLLQVELFREGCAVEEEFVLNEAVVNKGTLSRMIELMLSIDGEFVCRYRADGLVVATPTGSTAYSLSAGGPILHPSVEAFVITPICPHTLSDRPVVIRDNSWIELEVPGAPESVFLTLDGQRGIPLQGTDRVRISRAEKQLKLIQPAKKSYFEILRSKMKWGEA